MYVNRTGPEVPLDTVKCVLMTAAIAQNIKKNAPSLMPCNSGRIWKTLWVHIGYSCIEHHSKMIVMSAKLDPHVQ